MSDSLCTSHITRNIVLIVETDKKEEKKGKEKWQCPICFESSSCAKQIRLECAHCLCRDCAQTWLPKHLSCPLCRRTSERYNKPTRSQTRSRQLLESLHHFHEMIYDEVGCTFGYCFWNDMLLFGDYVQVFFLTHKDLWYRPEMMVEVKEFVTMVREKRVILERLWWAQFEETHQKEGWDKVSLNIKGEPRLPIENILDEFLTCFSSS